MSTENDHEPWPCEWTPNEVERYWNWMADRPGNEANYFAKQVGPDVLRQLRRWIPANANAVDFGCGLGHFSELLARSGRTTLAVDSSARSLLATRERLAASSLLAATMTPDELGATTSDWADVVFLLEVVEHLDDDSFDAVLALCRRVLRPNGRIVVTTPNDEDLAATESMCPHCGCVFHRIQHVRSWTAEALAAAFERHGFTTLACETTLFSRFQPWLSPMYRTARRLARGSKKPHLYFVGQRSAAG